MAVLLVGQWFVSAVVNRQGHIRDCCFSVLEPLNDDRADILMSYLQELEKRGPPPPPTASEPNRRK